MLNVGSNDHHNCDDDGDNHDNHDNHDCDDYDDDDDDDEEDVEDSGAGITAVVANIYYKPFVLCTSGPCWTLADTVVIPADRRLPEKEEIWALPNDQQETSTASFDEIIDEKSKVPQELDKVTYKTQESIPLETTDNADVNLPRSQETRKSKTKRVKSYLRKCKGALSKGDESVNEKKRQENCTSWYFEENQSPSTRHEEIDDYCEKYTELSEERLTQQQNDPEGTTSSETTVDVFVKTSEEEPSVNPESENRISISKNNATDVSSKQCESDEQTCRKECEEVIDTVTIVSLSKEDTNLDKCDSSDTLIAEVSEVSECVNEFNVDLNATIVVQQNDEKSNFEEEEQEEGASNDPEIPLILPLPAARGDVASLVRNLLGPIYGDGVINLLIRQARDILVCAYHGNLENFVKSYLSPAAFLLSKVKNVASETFLDMILRNKKQEPISNLARCLSTVSYVFESVALRIVASKQPTNNQPTVESKPSGTSNSSVSDVSGSGDCSGGGTGGERSREAAGTGVVSSKEAA
ncbi:hypothetical protein M0802_001681 [Mischocyttarus mexicanus]|nr:hypothetical protein M0802_001681 [Mischocyttarus mexicanus]